MKKQDEEGTDTRDLNIGKYFDASRRGANLFQRRVLSYGASMGRLGRALKPR